MPLGRLHMYLIHYLHMYLTQSSNFYGVIVEHKYTSQKQTWKKEGSAARMLNKFEISVNASFDCIFSIFLHFGSISFPVEHTVDCLLSDSRFVAENLFLLVLLVFTSFFLY